MWMPGVGPTFYLEALVLDQEGDFPEEDFCGRGGKRVITLNISSTGLVLGVRTPI